MKRNKIINYVMLVSLFVVFVSGFIVKVNPGMVVGITHALSGVLLFVSIMYHCITHGMFRK